METSLKTDTTKILKKLIKFYKERNISEEEEYEFTEGFVDKYLSENNKASLLRTLGLTANAEAFAQHYLLKGEASKGVNKLVQGLYWMYKCIQLQNFYTRTTPFLVYKFGYAMGISWLLGKDEILETIMAKFEEFLRYEKTTMVTHSFHTSFLYLLYKKDFTSLENYFDKRVKAILETGIEKEKISIDPGVGYSSNNSMNTPEDMERIKSVKYLRNMRLPIMIAISRKSFNEKMFGLSLEERLMGTLMFESLMVQDGGRILRVHDVKETRDILNMLEVYNKI